MIATEARRASCIAAHPPARGYHSVVTEIRPGWPA